LLISLRMSWDDFHLAQVNIARLIEPLDSGRLVDFVTALDPVNAAADAALGFVWRLKTEEGNATALSAFDWDRDGSVGVLTNMSVWESLEALKEFVYGPTHREIMRGRRQWFFRAAEPMTALWWIPKGAYPSLVDAEEKIRNIRQNGPSPMAFDFKRPYPPTD